MTPGEWALEKGVPLLVNAVLIPGFIWFVGAVRKVVKEFQDVGDSVKTHALELAKQSARIDALQTALSHVQVNIRDLGRYLGGDRAQPFKGFRPEEEESK